jgi:hypothetical protein
MLQVIATIKKEGGGIMKQYAFRSSSDGRALIEVLLDGSQASQVDAVVQVRPRHGHLTTALWS